MMKNFKYLLDNIGKLKTVKDTTLLRGYHQIFEQYTGLHPDGFEDKDSGWPDELKPISAEMWRRAGNPASTIKADQMYYINKSFRKLVAESAKRLAGRNIFANGAVLG